MYVAASTACFPEFGYPEVIERLSDLEYTTVELALHEHSNQMPPSKIVDDIEGAIEILRDSHRLDICNYDVRIDAEGDEHYRQFDAICKMAKATKVVTLTVPSAELGTPFNQEVEHLQKLVEIAENEGVRVAVTNQIGRMSEDPDSVRVLCDHVKGLGLCLDPSHYQCGPYSKKDIEPLMKYVFHVHLRDSKQDKIQVRVGQGIIDYGKIIAQLQTVGYSNALSVEMSPADDIDMIQELRQLRLLLESSL